MQQLKFVLLLSPIFHQSEIEHAMVFKFEPPETKNTNIQSSYPHMIPSDHDQQVGKNINSAKEWVASNHIKMRTK